MAFITNPRRVRWLHRPAEAPPLCFHEFYKLLIALGEKQAS
jgi:hypothetical protein